MSGMIDYREVYDELNALRRWKSEATTVLGYWDNAFERSGIDGPLGESKPTLMLTEIERLRAQVQAPPERKTWTIETVERPVEHGETFIAPSPGTDGIERWMRTGPSSVPVHVIVSVEPT